MKHILIITFLFFLTSMPFHPLEAVEDSVSMAEFRDALTTFAYLVGIDESTTQILDDLSEESWEEMYKAYPSKQALIRRAAEMKRMSLSDDPSLILSSKYNLTTQAIDITTSVDDEFEPKYPNMDLSDVICVGSAVECYASYIRSVHTKTLWLFRNPLIDGDEAGLQDDRCDDERVTPVRAEHYSAHIAAETSQTTCDASPDIVSIGTCAAALALTLIDYRSEEYMSACDLHGGNVDSAEIEAAFENSRTILDKSNGIEADTTLIKIDADSIRTSIETETNFTDDEELSLHNQAILSVISALDDKLIIIDGKLNQQQQQLDLITELLLTPQGGRPGWNEKP